VFIHFLLGQSKSFLASFNDSISPTSNEHINEHNKHEENDQNEEDERIEDAIMEMIATDALPLSTVEMPGFRHLMSVVMPGFEIRYDLEEVFVEF
jgi:hypothetical protein